MSEPSKKEKATEKASDKKAEKKPESAAPAARRFGMDRLMTVVLAPVVSEKSTFVADKNRQYVFRVADDATKPEIKAAVELMFKTQVKSVSVANVRGKEKRFGRFMGRRNNWKKAYVALQPGQEINFAEGESK